MPPSTRRATPTACPRRRCWLRWAAGTRSRSPSCATGERVLDLGSGGGIDVLLSARRVGPTGFAYGLDMTDEMLALARANAAKAGAGERRVPQGPDRGHPAAGRLDRCGDLQLCDQPVHRQAGGLAEMFRVLTPGGRLGISDVVAEDGLSPADRAERGSYVGCIAGALSRSEYLDGLTAAGFTHPEVEFTHEAAPGMHGAIVRAVKPAATAGASHEGRGRPDAGGVRRPAADHLVRRLRVGVDVRHDVPGRSHPGPHDRPLPHPGVAPLTGTARSSSPMRTRTRRSISSRTGRTPATSSPAGSSSTHSS